MRILFVLVKDFFIHSFRSRKAVIFLVLYLAVFLLISYGLIRAQARLNAEFEARGVNEQNRNFITEMARGFLKAQTDSSIVDYLLSVPFLNVALFLVSLFGTPVLITIWKYDLIAREASDKTFRFLVFRVSRFKIILAKYLSSMLEIMLVTLTAFLAAVIWALLSIPRFPMTRSFSAGIYFFFVSQLFFSVIVSFTLLVSVLVKKPFSALLLSYLGLLFLSVIPIWIPYVSPFDLFYLSGLFSGSSPELLRSAGIYLLFSIVYTGGGFLLFRRRNL